MPMLENRLVVRMARDIKAFLNLEAGITRGRVPESGLVQAQHQSQQLDKLKEQLSRRDQKIEKQDRQLKKLQERLADRDREVTALQEQRPSRGEPEMYQTEDRLTVFRKLLGLMPAGRLLDLGCGHGKFSLAARELGWNITAVDVRTERMPRTPGIEWVQSDVREFEFGEYDCISILGLLYHLELEDQLKLIRKCAGTPTIIDTHISPTSNYEEGGYEGRLFKEVPDATPEEHVATPTASWENKTSFWATEDSLVRMIRECGFSSVYKMLPPHTVNRTFYLCT